MGAKTVIEWTDSTWSPIRARVKADAAKIAREKGYASLVQIAGKMAGRVGQHCEHVSPGCEHCYAETNNHRCLPGNGTGLPYDRRSRDLVEAFVDEKVLLQPLRWGKIAAHSEPCTMKETKTKMCQCPWHSRRIFVENQSDLFGEWVTDEILDRVFAVMARPPTPLNCCWRARRCPRLPATPSSALNASAVCGTDASLINRFTFSLV